MKPEYLQKGKSIGQFTLFITSCEWQEIELKKGIGHGKSRKKQISFCRKSNFKREKYVGKCTHTWDINKYSTKGRSLVEMHGSVRLWAEIAIKMALNRSPAYSKWHGIIHSLPLHRGPISNRSAAPRTNSLGCKRWNLLSLLNVGSFAGNRMPRSLVKFVDNHKMVIFVFRWSRMR